MNNTITKKNGAAYYGDRRCTFESIEVRNFVHSILEVNDEFVLPLTYDIQITLQNNAKIILRKNEFEEVMELVWHSLSLRGFDDGTLINNRGLIEATIEIVMKKFR